MASKADLSRNLWHLFVRGQQLDAEAAGCAIGCLGKGCCSISSNSNASILWMRAQRVSFMLSPGWILQACREAGWPSGWEVKDVMCHVFQIQSAVARESDASLEEREQG